MLLRSLVASILAAVALAVTASGALAADTYVNGDDGAASDSNDCTVITTPCLTIGQGLIQAGAGDTVHVDDKGSSYLESQVLDDGKSIVADDFDNAVSGGFTILGNIGPTIAVPPGETAGVVSGFTLAPAPGQQTVFLEGPATLRDNNINNPNAGATAVDLSTPSGGTGTVIDDNTFNGDSTTANAAISISEGNPQIINNRISTPGNGFNIGVRASNDSNPTIDGNLFQAIFDSAGNEGFAVYVFDAHATITDNRMEQSGAGTVNGIAIQQNPLSPDTGASIRRNQLFGTGTGVGIGVYATPDPVTLDSNLVAGFATGIEAEGASGPTDSDGDISVNNATVIDNGQDVALLDTHITLDSSIVEDPISVGGGGNPGCTITFSRGPSMLPGACTQFQTAAAPGFVSTGGAVESNDYHLVPSSTMIDAGNPAVPAPGSLDLDGGARALDNDGACPIQPKRDIGADEFASAALDCTAPNTIKGKRKIKQRKRRARFTFSGSEAGVSFQCKLDRKPFAPCTSPKVYRKLKRRKHKFQVRAVDAAGNADPTPVVQKFRIRKRRPR